MTVDLSLALRQMLNIAPRWVRISLIASVINGECECLHTLAKIFNPTTPANLLEIIDIRSIATYDWPLIGLIVTMSVAFVWHNWRLRLWGRSNLDKAEEYIAILKLGIREANLPKTQQNFYWSAALARLARDFSVGSTPPPPGEVVQEMNAHDDTRDRPLPL